MIDPCRRSSESTRAVRRPEELSRLLSPVKVRLKLRTTQHPMRYVYRWCSGGRIISLFCKEMRIDPVSIARPFSTHSTAVPCSGVLVDVFSTTAVPRSSVFATGPQTTRCTPLSGVSLNRKETRVIIPPPLALATLLTKVRVALEAISIVGDVSVSKSNSSSSPSWTVTFLNNAGDLPLMTVDSSAMWGGVTVTVDEERGGTSEAVTGSFELGLSGNDTERVNVPHNASAVEVNLKLSFNLIDSKGIHWSVLSDPFSFSCGCFGHEFLLKQSNTHYFVYGTQCIMISQCFPALVPRWYGFTVFSGAGSRLQSVTDSRFQCRPNGQMVGIIPNCVLSIEATPYTPLIALTPTPLRHVSTQMHSQQLENALESLAATPDTLEVSRFELLNGGSLWTITFPAASGDVDPLYLNASGLTGTGLVAEVSEDVAGSSLGGSFYLYSNGGARAGFPVDAEGAYIGTEDKASNGTGRSEALAWNAEADDVRVAIEGLLPSYAIEGEI